MRGWLQDDVDESIAVRIAHHFVDHSRWQAARKDQIAPRGKDVLTRLNALIGQDPHHFQTARSVAAKNASNACLLQNHARPAGGIVDGQNLRGVRKDISHLAHDAVRCNHRHIRLQAVVRALIDIEDMRTVTATGAVDLGGQRGIDVLLLEAEQRLQPLALACILQQRGLLQP